MSRPALSSRLALGGLVVSLLSAGCVWRTPREPSEAETSTPEQAQPGVAIDDPDAADLPEGVTRTITQKPDGSEHVDINVDLTKYDPGEQPQVEMLPRPFSVEALKGGLPKGTALAFHIVDEEAGQGTVHWDITEATDEQVTIAYRLAEGSEIPPPPGEDAYPWQALAEHASFPAAFSSRTQGSVTTKVGRFDAWIYEVAPPEATPPLSERLYFVPSLPGPPVLHEIRSEGRVVHRMELVADSRVPAP